MSHAAPGASLPWRDTRQAQRFREAGAFLFAESHGNRTGWKRGSVGRRGGRSPEERRRALRIIQSGAPHAVVRTFSFVISETGKHPGRRKVTCSDFTFSKGLVAVRTADGGGGAGRGVAESRKQGDELSGSGSRPGERRRLQVRGQ